MVGWSSGALGRVLYFKTHGHASIQPVIDAQARNRLEVRKVAGKQGGIVSQADAGDFQILSADLLTERFLDGDSGNGGVLIRRVESL